MQPVHFYWFFVCSLILITSLPSYAEYKAPKNFFGDPDLQGTWTNATLTALQRLEELDSLVVSLGRKR